MTIQLSFGSQTQTLRARLSFAVVTLAALLWPSLAARALPPLPDDFINDEVIMLAVLDLAQATPSAIDATGRGVIERIPEFGDAIADLRADHQAFVNAGARFIVIAAADTQSKDLYAFMPVASVFVDAEHCDEEALAEMMKKHAKKITDDPIIERHGDWLLLWKSDRLRLINRKEDGPLLEIPNSDPARAERLRTTFGSLAGRAVAVMMVPTNEMHEEAQRDLGDLDPDDQNSPDSLPMLMASALSMHGWIDLGHNPSVTGVIELPDAPKASQLTGIIQGLPTMMQDQMDMMEEMPADMLEQMGPEIKLMAKVLTSISCFQQGSTVTVSIGQANLRSILDMAAPILEEQQKQAKEWEATAKSQQLGMAIIAYAQAHDNQWPASLDELVAKGQMTREELDDMLTNPTTGEKLAYQYVKPDRPMDQMEAAWTVPMIYQLKNGQIDKTGWIVYADGHTMKGSDN